VVRGLGSWAPKRRLTSSATVVGLKGSGRPGLPASFETRRLAISRLEWRKLDLRGGRCGRLHGLGLHGPGQLHRPGRGRSEAFEALLHFLQLGRVELPLFPVVGLLLGVESLLLAVKGHPILQGSLYFFERTLRARCPLQSSWLR
jgi:hypothetical protein